MKVNVKIIRLEDQKLEFIQELDFDEFYQFTFNAGNSHKIILTEVKDAETDT